MLMLLLLPAFTLSGNLPSPLTFRLLLLLLLLPASTLSGDLPSPLTFRLAFGSCNRQNLPQPAWPLISSRHPDAFAWLGDIMYSDHGFGKLRVPATLAEVAAGYAVQSQQPAYSAFASQTTVLTMWDDHDMGVNDGGGSLPEAYRSASKALLMDFAREPAGSARRARRGAYTAHFLLPSSPGTPARTLSADHPTEGAPLPPPPPGPYALLLLLDCRYFRDDPPPHPQQWGPAAPQDMLGEAQWLWLATQLQRGAPHPPAFTLLTSGVQVLPQGDPPVTEGWVRHPASLARLLALLALHAPHSGRQLLLSGDVHFGELSTLGQGASAALGLPPLHELTSSGLTHSWGGLLKGSVSWLLMSARQRAEVGVGAGSSGDEVLACSSNLPWLAQGGGGLCMYTDRNWGEVEMQWEAAEAGAGAGAATATATLRVLGMDGQAKITATVSSAAAAAAAGTSASAALPEATLLACAYPPPQATGLSPACLAVLGPLALARHHPSPASLALHCAVLGGLLALALGALGIPVLAYCAATGAASAALRARLQTGELCSHALVGALLAVYCSATGGVLYSLLEQLLV